MIQRNKQASLNAGRETIAKSPHAQSRRSSIPPNRLPLPEPVQPEAQAQQVNSKSLLRRGVLRIIPETSSTKAGAGCPRRPPATPAAAAQSPP